MRLHTFASGSSGNCALVSCGDTRVLVDAGISMRRISSGLSALGLSMEDISGVFITHEHSDHVSGLPMLIKHCRLPVFAPRTVASRLRGMFPESESALQIIHTDRPLALGDISVAAFHTMHDTPESVGYRMDSEDGSLGVCTDLGVVTDEVRAALTGVDAALIETNHDEDMLRYGPYPVYLKRRILSENGHLSNESGAELAACLAASGTKKLVLAHLSRENNTPEKALAAVELALERCGLSAEVRVAPPAAVISVEARARCSV